MKTEAYRCKKYRFNRTFLVMSISKELYKYLQYPRNNIEVRSTNYMMQTLGSLTFGKCFQQYQISYSFSRSRGHLI